MKAPVVARRAERHDPFRADSYSGTHAGARAGLPGRARQHGFTLLEMLVVLVIAGMLLSFVSLAGTRNPRTELAEEAQRLATLFEAAGDEAQLRASPIAWQPGGGGYTFAVRLPDGRWRSMTDDVLGPHRWQAPVTSISVRYADGSDASARVVFGRESLDVPVTVTLVSGSVSMAVVGSGDGAFDVERR